MLVIIGPSASGKTQIVNQLIQTYHLKKLVTYTTRPMRVGEIQDIDYHFLQKEEFEQKIKENFFLEFVKYSGNYYGTGYSDLAFDKVVIIEVEGLKKYISKVREQIKIVYIRCSKPIRRMRMMHRGDVQTEIDERLIKDDFLFHDSIRQMADLVIDSSNSNKYDDAKQIYQFYISTRNHDENSNFRKQ